MTVLDVHTLRRALADGRSGQRYASAEHFMMAEKARLFGDEETRALILRSEQPDQAKKLGRRVRNFYEAVWERERFDRVTLGNFAKFEQNPKLERFRARKSPPSGRGSICSGSRWCAPARCCAASSPPPRSDRRNAVHFVNAIRESTSRL